MKTLFTTKKEQIESGLVFAPGAERVLAKHRHQGRVDVATQTAIEFACDNSVGYWPPSLGANPNEVSFVAAALLIFELQGPGKGPIAKTDRLPRFAAAFGKGRRNASDGGAWNSAIVEAINAIIENLRKKECDFLTENSLTHYICVAIDKILCTVPNCDCDHWIDGIQQVIIDALSYDGCDFENQITGLMRAGIGDYDNNISDTCEIINRALMIILHHASDQYKKICESIERSSVERSSESQSKSESESLSW